MSSTVEYTFNDYPNVQLLVYKGADGKDLRIGGKDKFSRVLIKRKGVV